MRETIWFFFVERIFLYLFVSVTVCTVHYDYFTYALTGEFDHLMNKYTNSN